MSDKGDYVAQTTETPPKEQPSRRRGKERPPLPAPLVRINHPIKWAKNHLLTVIFSLVLVKIGTLIVVALYYLLFEVWPPMTHAWHTVVPNSNLRHDIRGVAEGLVGGLLGVGYCWNHYKRRHEGAVDRLMNKMGLATLFNGRKLNFGQYCYAFASVFLFGSVGFVVAYFAFDIAHIVHGHIDNAAVHLRNTAAALQPLAHGKIPAVHSSSVLDRTKKIDSTDWELKVMGLSAAFFFGRRPMWRVFDEAQGWFAAKRVARSEGLRWFHPPTFSARFNDTVSNGSAAATANKFGWLRSTATTLMLVIGVGLAVYGLYILVFVAKN